MNDIKLYAAIQVQMASIQPIDGDITLPNAGIVQAMEDGETYKYLGFQQVRLLETKQAKIKIKDQYLNALGLFSSPKSTQTTSLQL